MDELYYSNFKQTADNVLSKNFYGATGNIVIHKDCHYICSFSGASLYRIIIGLSDGNDNVSTKFVEFNAQKKINKNDFVLFDFSRTTHQVVKEKQHINTPRTLLKLHFLICEDCKYSNDYLLFLKKYFINYDIITRYILKTGTDPQTFYQFFIGLLTYYFYYPNFIYILLSLFIIIFFILKNTFKIKSLNKNILKLINYSLLSLFIIYLLIVLFYWLRFKLFHIR